MYTRFLVFVVTASILTIALYSTTISFVSASSTECFGDVNSLGSVICVGTTDNGSTFVFECTVTQNPYHVDCHSLNKVSIPAGVKANIDASVKEEAQSNTHDTKNFGNLKNDNLQTQERKSGEVPKQFEFPNKTTLAP